MNAISIVATVAFSLGSTAVAETVEGKIVFDCFLSNSVLLEPHQDNMLDLAKIIVETQCIAQRDAFLKANDMMDASGIGAFEQKMVKEVQSMVVAARAHRLGLELH